MSNYKKHIYARNRVLIDWTYRALLMIDIIFFIFTIYQLFNGKFTCISGLIIEILFAKFILKAYCIDI